MKKFFGSLLLALVFIQPVFAGNMKPGAWEIGPYGGYGFFDDYAGIKPKRNLLYGFRIGIFMTQNVSFESSYQMVFTDTDYGLSGVPNTDVRFNVLRWNLLYNMLTEGRVNPFVTGGLGWNRMKVKGADASNDLGVNVGLGLRIWLTNYLATRLEGRFEYIEVSQLQEREYNYEGFLGISLLLGGTPPTDTDNDGVRDKNDKCPSTPAGATVDSKGCPTDSDKDGVLDGLDKCADTSAELKVDSSGCQMDSDGDSIPDGPDRCPNTPANTPVEQDGCPKDEDGDGIADPLDECPNTAQGVIVDEKGCVLDSDKDGVLENMDLCPSTPAGATVDSKGCPVVTKARGVLKGVAFKSGSAELTKDSFTVLNEAAEALMEFPKVRVEVQGHTDNTGKSEINSRVSNARAETVVEYLVSKGVPRDRLIAKGYGSTKPIASNKTPAGRKKNRRVELSWLD